MAFEFGRVAFYFSVENEQQSNIQRTRCVLWAWQVPSDEEGTSEQDAPQQPNAPHVPRLFDPTFQRTLDALDASCHKGTQMPMCRVQALTFIISSLQMFEVQVREDYERNNRE